jgi:hypothetical protein
MILKTDPVINAQERKVVMPKAERIVTIRGFSEMAMSFVATAQYSMSDVQPVIPPNVTPMRLPKRSTNMPGNQLSTPAMNVAELIVSSWVCVRCKVQFKAAP